MLFLLKLDIVQTFLQKKKKNEMQLRPSSSM